MAFGRACAPFSEVRERAARKGAVLWRKCCVRKAGHEGRQGRSVMRCAAPHPSRSQATALSAPEPYVPVRNRGVIDGVTVKTVLELRSRNLPDLPESGEPAARRVG